MQAILPQFLRWVFGKYNARNYHPRNYEGEINISCIKQPATIYRDQWHIPHIYAQNTTDMFFCQGYVHAQDRIWQMEMNRRTGMGTLSESFGSDALSTDRLIRTLGFNRLAEADYKLLTEKHHSYLDAYCHGINEWLQNNKHPI